jgi:phospholipid/cholesterol/gamma-HCH transport system permease protein
MRYRAALGQRQTRGCAQSRTRLILLMNLITSAVYQIQEITLLTWRALRSLFRPPLYLREMVQQMDILGFGSLTIILLTGGFTGGVLALNSANTLQKFGVQSVTGQLVATSLIRELGPVLTCLMLAGRVGSGIAAELGSMLVSEQIDAMRALGTDPVKKLVVPRIIALVITAPALTIICDMIGVIGGLIVAVTLLHQPSSVYISSAQEAVTYNEIIGGLIKPTVFGFVIAIIGCYMGLSTAGGTVGVGRSTTRSVVVSSILIIVVDFLLTKAILALLLDQR